MPVHLIPKPLRILGPSQRLAQSSVSGGFPSPAGDDLEEEIDPISWVVRHPTSTFWWRVEGDCLWDAGIRDGDLIAVDRAGKRCVGRAVLAVVDGAVTAKILQNRGHPYTTPGPTSLAARCCSGNRVTESPWPPKPWPGPRLQPSSRASPLF